LPHDLTWFRNSAEYEAASLTVYNSAIAQVPDQCRTPGVSWIAIMDADETIFDNSDQQLEWQRNKKTFDPAEWNAWIGKSREGLIPGAREFIEAVATRCGHVVVITNRSDPNPRFPVDECKATRDRLQGLFGKIQPRNPIDAVLCAPVGPDGKPRGDKNPRFKAVASGQVADLKKAAVGMYIGDSITDLPDMEACPSPDALAAIQHKLGRTYFVLPNPTYGKWEGCMPRRRSAQP